MTEDGTQPANTQAPQQSKTVFQQPTSGFLSTQDEPEIANTYTSNLPLNEIVPQDKPATRTEEKLHDKATTQTPQEKYEPEEQQKQFSQATFNTQSTQTEEEKTAQQTNTQDFSAYFPNAVRPQPEEEVYSWQALSRPFKKHSRNYFTTIAVIVLLISLILIFAGQFVPMAVLCAVAFMAYVINTIPPQEIEYSISTYGVRIGEKLYYWNVMTRFWFSEKYGIQLLHIEIVEFPERLTLVIDTANKEILSNIFSEVLLLEKPELTVYERIAGWLQDKFPLDLDS